LPFKENKCYLAKLKCDCQGSEDTDWWVEQVYCKCEQWRMAGE